MGSGWNLNEIIVQPQFLSLDKIDTVFVLVSAAFFRIEIKDHGVGIMLLIYLLYTKIQR